MPSLRRLTSLTTLAIGASLLLPAVAFGAPGDPSVTLPGISLQVGNKTSDPGTSLSILALFTLLTLGPSLLIMMTGFTRIMIVMSFVRNALGTQQMPPNQVLVGFSLFLTLFVMAPTFDKINERALQPYLHEKITVTQALDRAQVPLKSFMLKQTRASDLQLFVKLSRERGELRGRYLLQA